MGVFLNFQFDFKLALCSKTVYFIFRITNKLHTHTALIYQIYYLNIRVHGSSQCISVDIICVHHFGLDVKLVKWFMCIQIIWTINYGRTVAENGTDENRNKSSTSTQAYMNKFTMNSKMCVCLRHLINSALLISCNSEW